MSDEFFTIDTDTNNESNKGDSPYIQKESWERYLETYAQREEELLEQMEDHFASAFLTSFKIPPGTTIINQKKRKMVYEMDLYEEKLNWLKTNCDLLNMIFVEYGFGRYMYTKYINYIGDKREEILDVFTDIFTKDDNVRHIDDYYIRINISQLVVEFDELFNDETNKFTIVVNEDN